MRIDDYRDSDNVEDRRGEGGGGIGRGGIGIGGVVLALVISYFTGINPVIIKIFFREFSFFIADQAIGANGYRIEFNLELHILGDRE